jgi:hypothetical protein
MRVRLFHSGKTEALSAQEKGQRHLSLAFG